MTFERTVPATPKEVYRAFTTPSALGDWLCNAAEVDPRKGGRVYFWWDSGYYTAGVFTSMTKDEGLAFTWRGPDEPEASEVSVTISPQDGRTRVAVTHQGIGSGLEWSGAADKIRRIWQDGLENLESVLEKGIDLRFARRPMFGLSGGDILNEETAARLGVPVKQGMRLDGLVEGMGAANAGLQKDDVVVRLAGHDITTFPSLTAALEEHQAGDKVEVVFYRGPEKHTVTMELSKRPMPEVPDTAEAVAAAARAVYKDLDPELEQIFEGVSEAEADYRPGPGEWNAKEVLAHLIAIERDNQLWMTAIVEDVEVQQAYHTNENTRLKALTDGYPTVRLLLDELKRNEATTLAMIEALPAEAVGRKHLFRQIGQWFADYDFGCGGHTREHIGMIKGLVEAARRAS
jgi:uncharacterized protein YndB with AHSA1/START domain